VKNVGEKAPSKMKRKYPDHPIVGVGAVVFQDNEVLLIQRGKEPALGQWSIPGGVVITGETLPEAVSREILEETHLEVEARALIKVLDRIFRDPDGRVSYHYVLVDFLCEVRGGKLMADSDALDARFVPLENLSSYEIAPITIEVIYRADRLRKNPGTGLSLAGSDISYG
jgi:8-oxo-dGTP diphosphatase